MEHERRDPTWCMVGYMDAHARAHLMDIPQSALPWALKNGWSLVLRYRDDPPSIDPAQSNPRRETGDDE